MKINECEQMLLALCQAKGNIPKTDIKCHMSTSPALFSNFSLSLFQLLFVSAFPFSLSVAICLLPIPYFAAHSLFVLAKFI